MKTNKLCSRFDVGVTGFTGTYYYGFTSGAVLREPYWRSYLEFETLKNKLETCYKYKFKDFPPHSVFSKMSFFSKVANTRLQKLEQFLLECRRLPKIDENYDWNQFINPLNLDLSLYREGYYKIIRLIEFSANIEVYHVRTLNGEYAVKSIDFKKESADRIINEIDIHRRLDHIHCLKFHGYNYGVGNGSAQNKFNLVLEVAHQSVLQLLENTAGAPLTTVRELFYQLLLGVDYLHQNDIIHRDLKPQNLLLMHNKQLKICDFGSAIIQKEGSLLEPSTPVSASTHSSPFYMAPEVMSGRPYDGRKADIYSIGKILFSMMAGERPYKKKTIETFTPEIKELLQKILVDDPMQRPTIMELLEGGNTKGVATKGTTTPLLNTLMEKG